MFRLPKKVIDDIQKYDEKLKQFLSGKINSTFFRGVRVPWGFYSQRGGKLLMSRLRIPAGILTPSQLKAIGIAAKNFADGKLHITTRQDIQIHNVPFENSIKIIDYLKDFNISPRGGGGNTVRNITCCYLSGICSKEKTEVYKMVWGLTEYLLSLEESLNLPRKFKIAFSGCEKDCAFTGVNDVGVIALDDGKFKVLCGGGMGAKSAVGKVLCENIDQDEVYYVIKSVFNVYNKYGDRKNRHHNRLRFLIEDIGWEKFYDLYKKELDNIRGNEYIPIRYENDVNVLPELPDAGLIGCSEDETYNLFIKHNTAKQKQKGYYYAEIRIPVGEISSEELLKLCEIEGFVPTLIFRTTQRQNIVLTNIPYDKMFYVYEKIKSIFSDFLYPETVLDIVSCKAATTCNLGICNAIDLAKNIIEELNSKLDTTVIEKLKDVKININGCPNACGQHPIGTISFSGLARRVYNRSVPFYKIYLGGKIDGENTKLAQEKGILPARVIPKFISELVLTLQGSLNIEYLTFNIEQLIKKYSYVPSYEEDKNYYIDFGKTEEFSFAGLSQGECGAGVIDMIEADLESAKQSLIKSKEKNLEITDIKDALIYSARALLVVKGVDPKSEEETIFGFIDKFINTGICNPEFKNLNEIYQNIVSNKITKEQAYEYTQKFYQEVKKIYSLMDSNFNFVARFKEIISTEDKRQKHPKTLTYDLRGTPCPINYVKIKLKLEELNIGDVLEVYLDDGEPIKNVPKSLINDGQEILKIEQVKNFFKVLIKRKV
ncbi:MAG: sulfurtransferase TusA family protein [Candidatus Omnitrophica bacterium]|nr:sulfurtransferase TusA family protein [Candidatus Omnitrophota bacterium]MCM8802607.1 sulfurtransferase TusA family protein [Candidatus Omnitrophota bacterium]